MKRAGNNPGKHAVTVCYQGTTTDDTGWVPIGNCETGGADGWQYHAAVLYPTFRIMRDIHIAPPLSVTVVPTTPTLVSVAANSQSDITVTWQDNSQCDTGLTLLRSDDGGKSKRDDSELLLFLAAVFAKRVQSVIVSRSRPV